MLIDPYHWLVTPILAITRESAEAVSVHVAKPHGYVFAPGQHAVVRITTKDGSSYIRQYSYAGATSESTLLFAITKSTGGIVSSWFVDTARAGDTIAISQAFTGPLMINADGVTTLGMIAGGSGIAPMMSHLSQLRQDNSSMPVTLLYSTRRNQRCFEAKLQPRHNETIHTRLTDTEPRFSPHDIVHALDNCSHILICGSRPFVSAMHDICRESLPNASVHAEAFSL